MISTKSHLLIDDRPLLVLPKLADLIGLDDAIFLQQLHYWITGPAGKERDNRRWIYNSYREWQENFPFWSPSTIKRIVYRLEDAGVIISKQFDITDGQGHKWYTINYVALDKWMTTVSN